MYKKVNAIKLEEAKEKNNHRQKKISMRKNFMNLNKAE